MGNVSEIVVKGHEVTGQFRETVKGESSKGLFGGEKTTEYQSFKTTIPAFEDAQLIDLLEKKDVTIRAESDKRSWFWTLVVSVLPWVLIIGFFVYSSKKFQERMGGGGGPFGFGRSKAKLYTLSTSNVTFQDVAGLDNAKKELQEIIDFLKDPQSPYPGSSPGRGCRTG